MSCFVNILEMHSVLHHITPDSMGKRALEAVSVFMYTFIVSTWWINRARLLLGCLLLLGQALNELLLLGLKTLLSALTCLLRPGTTSFGLVTVGQSETRVLIPK